MSPKFLDSDQAKALRTDLAARDGEPDGIRRARAHDGRHRRQGRCPPPRPARDRHRHQVRRLPHALSGRRGRSAGRRREQAPAANERRRAARQARDCLDPAFHRAAAALFRGFAGQAHGRARHRPALDLRVDPAGAERPQLCASGKEAPATRRTRAALSSRSWKTSSPAMSNTNSRPGSKRTSTASPTSEIAWREVLRDFWRDFIGAVDSIKDIARPRSARRARRDAGAAPFPAEQGRHRPARLRNLWQRPPRPEARQVRRLHRLLELSGVQVHPPAGRKRRRERRQGFRQGSRRPASTSRSRRAASARISSLARLEDKEEKPKRAGIPKGTSPDDITLEMALKLLSLPREVGKNPEDGEPIMAGIGRFGPYVQHGKTYASLEFGRRRAQRRDQSRSHADCGETCEPRQGTALRRRSGPFGRRSSAARRCNSGEEGPLRALT